jgi:hypothetical protein
MTFVDLVAGQASLPEAKAEADMTCCVAARRAAPNNSLTVRDLRA